MNYKIITKSIDVDLYVTITRFIIISEDGEIIDDAQGYGYKTFQSAQKAAWYKLKGGKKKSADLKKQAYWFWRTNSNFKQEIQHILEINCKNPNIKSEIKLYTKCKNITNFDIKYLDYL